MMKDISKINFFIAFLGLVFFTSCSKEKGDITPNVLRKLDKAVYSDGTFYNFTYDANGRLERIDRKDYSSTFSYTGAIVTEKEIYANPSTVGNTYISTLNAQGLVVTDNYTSGSINYIYEYEYNSAGYLTRYVGKQKTTSGGVFTKFTEGVYTYDSDNDLLSFKSFNASGVVDYKYDNEYDKKHYDTIGREFSRLELFGKSSVHFLTKRTTTSGSTITNTTFTGTFDNKGYTIGRVQTLGSTVLTGAFTYK